jgi:hypothetical protein
LDRACEDLLSSVGMECCCLVYCSERFALGWGVLLAY